MVADPNISACPLIYGYVNYSSAKRHGPLVFTDAPCWGEGRRPGSVLGGAGMAVTSTATNLNAIAVYLERVASEKVQRDVFPRFGGQPAASAAWDEGDVNAESMDFYRNTRRTLDDAWVRPRLSGWSEFQEAGAVLVRKVLSQTITTCEAVGLINNKYRDVVKQEK
jgi:multiple sugar transport system substrate-binding protein